MIIQCVLILHRMRVEIIVFYSRMSKTNWTSIVDLVNLFSIYKSLKLYRFPMYNKVAYTTISITTTTRVMSDDIAAILP